MKVDPRIKKTLLQIDYSLLNNLEKFPFQKITIDMICKDAMINRSTFYKYYADKYDLLDNFLSRTLQRFREEAKVHFVLATPATIDDDVYMNIFDHFIDYIAKDQRTFQILWQAGIERDIFREMENIIHDRILETLNSEAMLGDRNLKYADLYARFFSSHLMLLIKWWFANEREVTPEDVQRIMNGNMKSGLFKTFKELL